jgi:hypothetical protein
MNTHSAVTIAEGSPSDVEPDEYIEAWQYLVDTGLAWRLQGWFGRNAWAMINHGLVNLPEEH